MNKTQKWLAVILCVCFFAVIAFSAATIVSHADHECAGEHCEICLQIAHLQNTLKQLGTAVFAIALTLAVVCAATAVAEPHAPRQFGTLISLKVQLNN